MLQDLREAVRSLSQRPGFAVVAVLTLALGIGVNVSIFGLVSVFYLEPLPVENPRELVLVLQRSDAWNMPHGHSYPDFRDYRDGTQIFESLTAFGLNPVHLSVAGSTPERTWVQPVAPGYFELAGVRPYAGTFIPADLGEKAEPIAVLSHAYWTRRFGGDTSIVGQPIVLNGQSFTVIGIGPEGFNGLWWGLAPSAFVPAGAAPLLSWEGVLTDRSAPLWRVMGRLKEGATFEQARAEVQVVAERLAQEYPDEHKGAQAFVTPEMRARPDPTFADFTPIFALVFVGMVALVLFIACANVANLMLSRSIDRRADLVLRATLGASRLRLVRLQVIESVLLAFVAGALGMLLAHGMGLVLTELVPPSGDIPVITERSLDWRIYLFTFIVSAIAGIGTGLWPALRASRFQLSEALKEGSARLGGARHPLRNLLVVGQVTLSLVVLICAGLFLHSLRQMQDLKLGFRTDNVLMLSLDLELQQYEPAAGRSFLKRLVERADALPGVRSSSLTLHVPFDYGIQIMEVGVDKEVPRAEDGYLSCSYTVVGHDYVETAGVTLMRGRAFREDDGEDAPRVAIVNETMAKTLWEGEEAIGQRFRLWRDGDWVEVVGVAADGKYVMIGEEPRSYFYLPFEQHYRSPMTLMVWSAGDTGQLVGPLQSAVRELDPDLPIFNIRTMEGHVQDSMFGLAPLRFGAALAGVQGLIALLLAVMGLYGVVSYAVSQRTHEIGVRMALGAGRANVLRLVVRQGLWFTIIGVILGLLISVFIGLVLSKLLYGVSPMDLRIYGGVTALLAGVAAAACLIPARRATRVDPMVALRYE